MCCTQVFGLYTNVGRILGLAKKPDLTYQKYSDRVEKTAHINQ